MIGPTSPLEAYRADLAAGLAADPSVHGSWLVTADLLTRLVPAGAVDDLAAGGGGGGSGPSRQALETLLDVSDREPPAAATAESLGPRLIALADRMEAGGALRLAWATLVLVVRALPEIAPGARGIALAQRARIARKLGELDVAAALYADAARAGRVAGDPTLAVRATIGRGVVARVRGNYPVARGCFEVGAREAARLGLRDLESHAHHGLLLAAEAAEDYDRALRHGWAALRLAAGDPSREAELLVNLAGICGLAGARTAAVRANLAAADRVAEPRVRVLALASAADDAAVLGDMTLVRALTTVLRPELAAAGVPYEVARARTLLARAWAEVARRSQTLGPEAHWSSEFAAAARAAAERHGFHELVHDLDRLGARRPTTEQAGAPAPTPARVTGVPDGVHDRPWTRVVVEPAGGGFIAVRSRGARAVVSALTLLPVGAAFAPAGAVAGQAS